MSEVIVGSILSAVVTVVVTIAGVVTLWLKLKYGVEVEAKEIKSDTKEMKEKTQAVKDQTASVERKIDSNTIITNEAKEAAKKAEHQTNGVMNDFKRQMESSMEEHRNRIIDLEKGMVAVQSVVITNSKDVVSTRHEMRGHLQTIINKLDLIFLTRTREDIRGEEESRRDDRMRADVTGRGGTDRGSSEGD